MSTKHKKHRPEHRPRSRTGTPPMPAVHGQQAEATIPVRPRQTGHQTDGSEGLAAHATLGPRYRAWHSRILARGNANEDLEHQKDLLRAYARRNEFPTIDSLNPEGFGTLVELVLKGSPGASAELLDVLDRYLHFLQDEGLWQGPKDEFATVHALTNIRVSRPGPRKLCADFSAMEPTMAEPMLAILQWARFLLSSHEGRATIEPFSEIALIRSWHRSSLALIPGLPPLRFQEIIELLHALDLAGLHPLPGHEPGPTALLRQTASEYDQTDTTLERRVLKAYLLVLMWSITSFHSSEPSYAEATDFLYELASRASTIEDSPSGFESSFLFPATVNLRNLTSRNAHDHDFFAEALLPSGLLGLHHGELSIAPLTRAVIAELCGEYGIDSSEVSAV
ncbi:hypothetical protein GCM10009715_20610 [Paeniglutamicibacter psychrophenolicus]|uniref:DUF2785 domain-containing protein n=1 Tax=Paeniglutamicibacter psychrophenolicus TaxID=257454 RepID=A0ABS4WH16_9MICC|nr:hypothetical protein [Paeniglutamicibacter psychrophenolicus]MBP2375500.1 hypothetical protein [Paeniglutamicibacter psychrophenolicus]